MPLTTCQTTVTLSGVSAFKWHLHMPSLWRRKSPPAEPVRVSGRPLKLMPGADFVVECFAQGPFAGAQWPVQVDLSVAEAGGASSATLPSTCTQGTIRLGQSTQGDGLGMARWKRQIRLARRINKATARGMARTVTNTTKREGGWPRRGWRRSQYGADSRI